MAGGTPKPTKTPTPTPPPGRGPQMANPTKRVKLPPGILGRTPTKGEQGRGLQKLVEAFIPESARNAPRETQLKMARKTLASLVHVSKAVQKKYGLTDVQSAAYLRAVAAWRKSQGTPKGQHMKKPEPTGFR